jgi:hypothetical protein
LQAHFDDGSLIGIDVPKNLFDRFRQDGGVFRSRFAAHGVSPRLRLVGGSRNRLTPQIPTVGRVVSDAIGALADRNQGEQPPQVAGCLA